MTTALSLSLSQFTHTSLNYQLECNLELAPWQQVQTLILFPVKVKANPNFKKLGFAVASVDTYLFYGRCASLPTSTEELVANG